MFMVQTSVGIREAKAHLGRLIREVKEGKVIVLTERGRPVAQPAPVSRKDLSLEERIARLEQLGYLEPKKEFSHKIPPPLPLAADKARQYLEEDRRG